MTKQLDFFEKSLDMKVEERLREIEEKHLRISRSQYAKIADQMKIIYELKERLDTIESAMTRCGLEICLTTGQVTFHSMKLKSA